MMLQEKKLIGRNPSWPQSLDHPYRTLVIGDPGSGKAVSLFSLIIQQPNIDKNYLYAKDPLQNKILIVN